MELKHYFSVIVKWAWLLVLTPLVAAAITVGVSSRMEPVYRASTTLWISQTGDASRADYTALLTSERIAKTYAELITKRPVLEKVISDLQLDMQPQQLAGDITIRVPSDTQLLVVQVEAHDPHLAVAIANSLAATFLDRNRQQSNSSLNSYERILIEQMVKVQAEIRDFQRQLAAMADDPAPLAAPANSDATQPVQPDIVELQTALSEARRTYATLLGSYLQLQSIGNKAIQIEIAEPAAMPAYKVRPRIVFNTAIAAVAGLMLALGLIFLVDYLDESLDSNTSVEQALHLPALATIPSLDGNASRAKVPHALVRPTSLYAEAFRGLRTSLQFSNIALIPKTVLFTSTYPQEGKTSTVSNLGVVMAQTGKRVLLVDADLRQGNLHELFDLPNQRGLSDLLAGSLLPDESWLLNTAVPNLKILPRGSDPDTPSELLSSEHMSKVLTHLSRMADQVLVDSSPVLAVTDALVLAPRVDGVVLVLQAGRVSRTEAQKVVNSLLSVGATVMGTVLTRSKTASVGYYYVPQPSRLRRLLGMVMPSVLQGR
jgi:non-specific protein-tyrosine kinase